jgi:fermentation-respiration switch protein FrsA (DUF1100 family)
MSADWPSLGLRFARGTILVLAIAWLFALGLLWLLQRNFLYQAPRTPPGAPPPGYTAVEIQTSDGLNLTAWYRPAAANRPTMVFFSAQGASLPWSGEWAEGFAHAGFGLLLVSFRGFDANPGSPGEQGLYRDGRAALAWLAAHDAPRPVLVGLSLGTGVAAELAAEAATRPPDWPAAARPRALILLSPYASIAEMAAMRYPIFPARTLVKDRFDTEAKIAGVRLPLLVVHGELDELIPFAQGLAVYNKAPEPKTFVVLPGAGHNYPSFAVLQQVETFLAGLAD